MEVVSCTARNGDTFTIARAAGNTTAEPFKAGDKISLRLSAASGRPASSAPTEPADRNGRGLPPAPRGHGATRDPDEGPLHHGSAPLILPVPCSMVVREAQGLTTASCLEPDEAMPGLTGRISSTTAGLIVDPIYVAGLFADLQTWLTGLHRHDLDRTGWRRGRRAVHRRPVLVGRAAHRRSARQRLPARVAGRDAGHHGRQREPDRHGPGQRPGHAEQRRRHRPGHPGDRRGRLRWGWQTNGVLARTRLVPPALPAGNPAPSLPQRFYRVAVADTVWALLGNRTGATVLGIPADDQKIPGDLLPAVRDQIVIDYLADGPDTLAKASAVLTRPSPNVILAVSPALDTTMGVPTQAGANGHWPGLPCPNGGTGFASPPVSAADGITAAWAAGHDVVVTVAAGKVPDGAHIRIYPQVYVTIPAITAQPSFLRGDGGAAIARACASLPRSCSPTRSSSRPGSSGPARPA